MNKCQLFLDDQSSKYFLDHTKSNSSLRFLVVNIAVGEIFRTVHQDGRTRLAYERLKTGRQHD